MRLRAGTRYAVLFAVLFSAATAGTAADPQARHPPTHGTQHPPPATASPVAPRTASTPGSQTGAAPGSFTLADLEQLALRYNPTLAQAAAQIEASPQERLRRALPFAGTLHGPPALRNYLPYGRELLDQGLEIR